MTQQLRILPMPNTSQLPVTQAPEDPMPSSGLHRPCVPMHKHTELKLQSLFKKWTEHTYYSWCFCFLTSEDCTTAVWQTSECFALTAYHRQPPRLIKAKLFTLSRVNKSRSWSVPMLCRLEFSWLITVFAMFILNFCKPIIFSSSVPLVISR